MGCAGSKIKDEFQPQRAEARKFAAKKDFVQAEKIYRDILQQQRKKLTLGDPDVLDTMSSLADVLEQQKKTKEAAEMRNAIRDRLVRQMPKPAAKKAPLPKKAPPPKKAVPPKKAAPPKKAPLPKKAPAKKAPPPKKATPAKKK